MPFWVALGVKRVDKVLRSCRALNCLGTPMIIGKPAPFVNAFIDAVDAAIRAQSPSHGLSALQRTWLAFCVTAGLVTNSICWARFARASIGTYTLAPLSWTFRPSQSTRAEPGAATGRAIRRENWLA